MYQIINYHMEIIINIKSRVPAVITNDYKEWHVNGKQHRDYDQPAFVGNNGYMAWYKNDKRHRDHGPAIDHGNGNIEWYHHGIRIK
jgi:hypothetical protein